MLPLLELLRQSYCSMFLYEYTGVEYRRIVNWTVLSLYADCCRSQIVTDNRVISGEWDDLPRHGDSAHSFRNHHKNLSPVNTETKPRDHGI